MSEGWQINPLPDALSPTILGLCNSGYCNYPAVAYVSRRRGPSGRVVIILARRAQELSVANPLELRCLDCVHHEVDIALIAEFDVFVKEGDSER